MDKKAKAGGLMQLQIKKLYRFSWRVYIVPVFLAIFAGLLFYLDGIPKWADMVLTCVHNPDLTMIYQSLILFYIMYQVLTYRHVSDLIGIRQKTHWIEKKLLKTVVAEAVVFVAVYDIVLFLDGNPPFINGSPMVGSLLLLGHLLVMIICAILSVLIYRVRRPGCLILLIQMLNLAYHFVLELPFFLIIYSPVYDPLYRALHHIYG